MEKLKALIGQHSRWQPLGLYVSRIETHIETDFSLSLENAKALLESISKEICNHHGVTLGGSESFNAVLKKAFTAFSYGSNDLTTQISTSLSNIAQQMGNLRNEIGTTSHGKSLNEIVERNNRVNEFTKEFLIDSTVLVACFLIRNFEQENPIFSVVKEDTLAYEQCELFNQEWDDIYGEFSMGNYSFSASEILFGLDNSAYTAEYKAYKAEQSEL